LSLINDWIKDIDPKNLSFAPQGGYRSMMAASILQARGFEISKK
jgi:rhodanese-related sulfurtransferase